MLCIFRFVVSLVNGACNSPWVRYESNCYLLYNVSSVSPGHTWNDSRLICRRYGGDLVKLDTEMKLLLKLLMKQLLLVNFFKIRK